ncbi:N-acetylglucosamine-6-phosphate deacetylase [Aliiruegeria lutimaris]|uniref:N-acetylglucosamine-6-phosphate deacetylase n=1 Tax=Aliiruegeria lutimaris TaxID=571298 RepID=A0A1G8PCM6_9RHOB|nr:N-acetylglucosamine-6-phosphate deacetylase [Aliiruegeria lutimaris]SDI89490.1 N-acetylglucosamine-6-phosphate deacetylase [Aliiruegeria lutimaris]
MAECQPFGLLARTLYDGIADEPEQDILIRIAGGRIESLQPVEGISGCPGSVIEAEIVTPGFIDLQINGANDVQFNHAPNVYGLKAIAEGARAGGCAHFLPTFTTAPGRAYQQAVDAVRDAISEGVPGILGIHLEGPFFSRKRPGIHPAEHIRALDDEDVGYLCQAARAVPILLTLAPECQQRRHLRQLSAAGVILFAGHSAATAEEMTAARADGVVGATHLFNAMSQTLGREPGIVGEVLGTGQGFAGTIADGIHVHPLNLSLAARSLPDGLCLVTDAMQTLAGKQAGFDLYGKPIRLEDGKLTGPDGTLAGAHLAMDEAVRNLHGLARVPLGRCVRMASANPARCLKLQDEVGRVAPGSRASLSLLASDWSAVGVVIDGTPFLQ